MREITAKMGSILLLLPAFGCSDKTVGPQPRDLGRVEVSVEPANLVLPVGDGLQLIVSMTGADATPLGAAGVMVVWVSSDEAIETVSPAGHVRAWGGKRKPLDRTGWWRNLT